MKYHDTDWKNIRLNTYEIEERILEPYTFESLLLEINCGIKEINEKTVKEHFNNVLQSKIQEAREIFNDNLKNIVKFAQDYRKEN